MVFIDIHCHLDFYNQDNIEKIIKNAKNNNVNIIVNCSLNFDSLKKSFKISEKHLEVKCAAGVYPTEALNLSKENLNNFFNFIKKNNEKISAIGEVGMDLKENTIETIKTQEKIFRNFIELAIKLKKPLIVHSRKAENEVVEILQGYNYKKIIMHCFSGKFNLVKKIVSNRWFISIPTSVKSSEHFQKIIEITPLELLFCETDSPFLHPEKKRDNEPANVIESYKKISEIKKIELKKVEEKIYENFNLIFN